MVEIKDFDHHTSTVLTYAGPTPNTHLNSHHDLTFRTKEMNAESTGNMSVDEDPSGKRLGESASTLPGKDQVDQEGHAIRDVVFTRLAREIFEELKTDMRLSSKAIEALQEAAEAILVIFFEVANQNAIKNERDTVNLKDLAVARLLMKYGPSADLEA
ncbi:hypothetical protein IFR04_008791 [Cadophora malorum]|uniref:Core Histone H2A/H2B/H3 domain-containing protein n=1 Tax=Cadophora malorum TaxID=108018 RepID=A0A8H7TAM1_9HELO|nr:hypothetical protein IFR04_008791 [Cadophora malorum]